MIKRSRISTTHLCAQCSHCEEWWDDQRLAADKARAHAVATGHAVKVERMQVWTYNPKPKNT